MSLLLRRAIFAAGAVGPTVLFLTDDENGDSWRIDPDDGSVIWKNGVSATEINSAEITPNYFYAGNWAGEIRQISYDGAESGGNWPYSTPTTGIVWTLVKKYVNGVPSIIFGEFDSPYAVGRIAEDGTKIWENTDHSYTVRAVCVLPDGDVLSGGGNSEIKKMDGATGAEKTVDNFPLSTSDTIYSMTSDSNGNIYYGTSDRIIKLDPTGAEITNENWPYINSGNRINVLIFGVDGNHIYAGDSGGNLTKHTLTNSGGPEWSFSQKGGNASNTVQDGDGFLYTVNDSAPGYLQKVKPDGTEITSDNWPNETATNGSRALAVYTPE